MYRRRGNTIELFLVHPGGPLYTGKDLGVWSIPKGEYTNGEDPLTVARREIEEETGARADGEFIALGTVKQAGGKTVVVWAVEGDYDAGAIRSNTFVMEWPPKSGRRAEFPEVDRAEWFAPPEARQKLIPGQVAFIDRLCEALGI
jgi:predicted NUDIX family NTP pyrophosphohydrolase